VATFSYVRHFLSPLCVSTLGFERENSNCRPLSKKGKKSMNNVSEDLELYPESGLKLPISKLRRWTAMTLFCCPEFAQTLFREMDLEDWRIHAMRAWEISGVLAKELWQQKRKVQRDTASDDGRSLRKIAGTIDDVLARVPEDGIILKNELYQKLDGLVARDDTREFVAQLLRDDQIFIHRISNPGKKPLTGYSRSRSAVQAGASST
jgi:hypothetical protein